MNRQYEKPQPKPGPVQLKPQTGKPIRSKQLSPYHPGSNPSLLDHYSAIGNQAAQRLHNPNNPNGIPEPIKTQMENTFQTDLSDVSIVPNSSRASQMEALAYTQGNKIHFAPGMYNPHSRDGQKIIKHEIVHVDQQRKGRVSPTGKLNGLPINDNPALEREADHMAAKVPQLNMLTHHAPYHGFQSDFRQNDGYAVNASTSNPIQGIFVKLGKVYKDDQNYPKQVFSILEEKDDGTILIGSKQQSMVINPDTLEIVGEVMPPVKVEKGGKNKKTQKEQPLKITKDEKNLKDQEERQTLIDEVNSEIFDEGGPENFFAQGLAPNTVRINIINEIKELELNKMRTRLASFSKSLLAYINKDGFKTPEIQTAIVQDPDQNIYNIEVSGNNMASNEALGNFMQGNLSSTYDQIRPFHIEKRNKILWEFLSSKGNIDINDFQKNFAEKNPEINTSKMNDTEFDEFLKALSYYAHSHTKREPENRQRKSSKAFVKKPFDIKEAWGPDSSIEQELDLGSKTVEVPQNPSDLHAESAILKKLLDESKRIIKMIGGTKVACAACQAFFTKHNQDIHLGPDIGNAWLAETSRNQLETSTNKQYLKEIYRILEKRAANLRFYLNERGNLHDSIPEYESSGTDSEDEEAMNRLAQDDKLRTLALDLIKNLEETPQLPLAS